ncbi:ATP phosphoribosyltransferase regulatory subunit, partial [Limnofasciculus baicalensis]
TDAVVALIDTRRKVRPEEFAAKAKSLGISDRNVSALLAITWCSFPIDEPQCESLMVPFPAQDGPNPPEPIGLVGMEFEQADICLFEELAHVDAIDWCDLDFSVVRGLAYYTDTVFEVLADGERAIAGGGRYDNLIELFGGPATPAVGFGMGDVVLSLVLQDRGLLPEGDALMDALSRPSASYRPDVFVIPAGQSPEEQEAAAKAVRPLVAKLRRGVESKAYQDNEKRKPWDADRYALASNGAPPLHARSSNKATKNIGKLLQDAAGQKAKLAVIVENAEEVTIKDLRTNQQDATRTKIAELGRVVAERLGV